MIATWNVPGSQEFEFVRVRTKAEAHKWWEIMAADCERGWLAGQGRHILTEREATRVRWRDGSRVYPDGVMTLAQWTAEREQLRAEHEKWLRGVREQAEQDNAGRKR